VQPPLLELLEGLDTQWPAPSHAPVAQGVPADSGAKAQQFGSLAPQTYTTHSRGGEPQSAVTVHGAAASEHVAPLLLEPLLELLLELVAEALVLPPDPIPLLLELALEELAFAPPLAVPLLLEPVVAPPVAPPVPPPLEPPHATAIPIIEARSVAARTFRRAMFEGLHS
jgi:hypothetical protein